MANATCQFTQGASVGGNGQSVVGFVVGSLITMTDAGGNAASTTWQWVIVSWPGPLSVPPPITNATARVAQVTPALDGVYIVQLTRVENGVTTIDTKFFGVVDADGLILPSAGQTGAMTNVGGGPLLAEAAGWMGRVNAATNLFLDAYLRFLKAHKYSAGGDLAGSGNIATVIAIQGVAVKNQTPTDGQLLTFVLANNRWEPKPPPVSFVAGGDISGTATNQTVIALQGHAVRNQTPTDGQLLQWVAANSDWEPTTRGPSRVYGVAGTVATTQASPQTLCYFGFDPSLYPTAHRTITFTAVLQCASASDTATLTLLNFTDAVTVTTLTHTGDTAPFEVSVTLTVPANLPNSRKLFYMTLQRTGGTAGDAVTVHTAYLEVSY